MGLEALPSASWIYAACGRARVTTGSSEELAEDGEELLEALPAAEEIRIGSAMGELRRLEAPGHPHSYCSVN
jgi:hypothetical protein